jgi:hypothetical protein
MLNSRPVHGVGYAVHRLFWTGVSVRSSEFGKACLLRKPRAGKLVQSAGISRDYRKIWYIILLSNGVKTLHVERETRNREV